MNLDYTPLSNNYKSSDIISILLSAAKKRIWERDSIVLVVSSI
jgi:hypothetical protein